MSLKLSSSEVTKIVGRFVTIFDESGAGIGSSSSSFRCFDFLNFIKSMMSLQDTNLITTTDAERRVVTPGQLQEAIDELVSQYASGRAFVR